MPIVPVPTLRATSKNKTGQPEANLPNPPRQPSYMLCSVLQASGGTFPQP